MIISLLQIVAVTAIGFYFASWWRRMRRRKEQTWETLLAQLRPDWSGHELSDHFLWEEGLSTTPEEAWKRMQGAKGLWVIYKNAQVMLEMANYAAKNCEGVDRTLIENLHSDAIQIRVCVLMALAQYAFTQASEGVRVNAFRAASLYTGMAARMTQLLQGYAAVRVPDFVAAM